MLSNFLILVKSCAALRCVFNNAILSVVCRSYARDVTNNNLKFFIELCRRNVLFEEIGSVDIF